MCDLCNYSLQLCKAFPFEAHHLCIINNSQIIKTMKTKIKEIIKASTEKLIKVQLDAKTFIYLRNIASLQIWLTRYPDATVITN
jgi:hypothetical protein